MSNATAARIRTWWPILVGHVVTIVITLIFRATGITLDSALVFEVVSLAISALVTGAAWEAGRRLENSANPTIASIGRWLIAAGKVIGSPTYQVSAPTAKE